MRSSENPTNFEIGLKIVALIRDGQLNGFQCSMCTKEMKEKRNCSGEDREDPVYFHKDVGEFYACPLTFISNSVYSFIDEYDWYEKYPASVPSYKDVNPRYWDSVKFYEKFKYKLLDKTEDKNKNTEDNMTKMSNLFKKK